MSETRIRNNWRIARKKILLQRCHLIQHSKSHASHEYKTSSRRDRSVDIIGLYLFWNFFPCEETNFYFYSLPFKRKLLLKKKSYQFGFAIILWKNTVEKKCLPAFFRWVRRQQDDLTSNSMSCMTHPIQPGWMLQSPQTLADSPFSNWNWLTVKLIHLYFYRITSLNQGKQIEILLE